MRFEVLSYTEVPKFYGKGIEYILMNEHGRLNIYTSYKINLKSTKWQHELYHDDLYYSVVEGLYGQEPFFTKFRLPISNRYMKRYSLYYRKYDLPF